MKLKPLIVEMFVDHDFGKWFDDPKGFEIIRGDAGQMSLVVIHDNASFYWDSEANGPGIHRHHNLVIERGERCWFIRASGTDITSVSECWKYVEMHFVSFGGENHSDETSQWIPVSEEVWDNFGEKHLKQLQAQFLVTESDCEMKQNPQNDGDHLLIEEMAWSWWVDYKEGLSSNAAK